MRNTNKKGFTIVELVIVVAVIAILAAVLIPTFSGIIRKANISSDTVVAKNLNTAAIAAEADTFEEAIAAAREAGYYLANLNAKADECYFAWDDENNQFVLVDGKDNYKVLYSNSTVTSDKAKLMFAISSATLVAKVEAAGYTVKKTIASVADLKDAIAAGGTIYMDESVVLGKDYNVNVTTSGAVVTLELGNSTVASAELVPGLEALLYVKDSTLNINGGIITAGANGTVDADTGENVSTQIMYDPGSNGTVKDSKFVFVANKDGSYSAVVAGEEVTFDNVSIQASSTEGIASGIFAGYGTDLTVKNCTIEATNSAIFASALGGPCSVKIDGGEYTGANRAIWVNGGTVTILGGTFNGGLQVDAAGTLVINGGTFTVDPSAYVNAETHKVTENNGVWTVTAK